MSRGARVLTSEALRDFRGALAEFADAVARAMGEVDAEVARTGDWLHHDRASYWRREVRRREERVVRARDAIARKRLIAAPEPASVVEERKALDAEERRLESARARQDATRRWSSNWARQAAVFKASCAGLGEVLQRDVPRAMERLERLVEAVEAYERVAPAPDPEGGLAPGAREALSEAAHAPSGIEPARLRALAPSAPPSVERSAFPLFATDPAGPGDADAAALDALAIAGGLPEDDSLVTIERAALREAEIVFVRARSAGPGESGWTIGRAGACADAPSAWARVPAGEVLSHRASWRAILRLAPGTLVLMDAGRVARVLGPDDADLWSDAGADDGYAGPRGSGG